METLKFKHLETVSTVIDVLVTLRNNLFCHIRLYANDTVIYYSSTLECDFNTIQKWFSVKLFLISKKY